MFSLSSPLLVLAIKRQLKFNTTAIFLVVFLLTLNNTSCEARHLRVHGKHSSNNLPTTLPPQMMRSSTVVRFGSNFDASMRNGVKAMDVKMKAVASSTGGVRNTRPVVWVLRHLLSHYGHEGGDQEIHLDYAQPRTHTPHHNR
ncbi:hypothetical protein PR202_ga02226 [Eleusine coracana subsp. coracana]|uniref:Transmembrane protein n=1 Tax=Eleusine coracana subsp. coracana TaxID=191504 RepID=A0AAV5BL49_ELECO|nr:hypothetical protein PR202_ga02226 [Eleusine coracana subsp. coracana]